MKLNGLAYVILCCQVSEVTPAQMKIRIGRQGMDSYCVFKVSPFLLNFGFIFKGFLIYLTKIYHQYNSK